MNKTDVNSISCVNLKKNVYNHSTYIQLIVLYKLNKLFMIYIRLNCIVKALNLK